MPFSPGFLDDLRIRVPISTLVKSRVTFDRRKSSVLRGDYWACCPFHGEKTPSFRCNDRKGRYYCFGCGASGDHFHFLSELEGLSFLEAVEHVANIAGISLLAQNSSARQYGEQQRQADLHDILEQATQFFEKSLFQKKAKPARKYISDRAITPDLQKMFRVGYACSSRKRLKEFFLTKGISERQLITSGLLVSGEGITAPYDRFRDRIMFPIEDMHGKIVGFGGRTLTSNAQTKYLNSPETELFHKGKLLYNFSRAKDACRTRNRQKKSIIVVEGYIDVISLVGAGFVETVASLGTALTEEQFFLLWNVCDQPVLCFDGDDAGRRAAFRALERAIPLLRTGSSLSFILLPTGKDPDDIVRTEGVSSFKKLLLQAIPLIEMLWYRETFGKDFSTPEQRAVLEKHLREAVFAIKDESLRYYYLQDIRERLRVFFQPVSFSSSYRKERRYISQNDRCSFNLSKIKPLQHHAEKKISMREATILFILINHLHLWNENFEILAFLRFTDSRFTRLHHVMIDILALDFPENTEAMKNLLAQKGETKTLGIITQCIYSMGVGAILAKASPRKARQILREAVYLHWQQHSKPQRLREAAEEIYKSSEKAAAALCNDLQSGVGYTITVLDELEIQSDSSD